METPPSPLKKHLDDLVGAVQEEELRLVAARAELEAQRAQLLAEHQEKIREVEAERKKMAQEHALLWKSLEEERQQFEAEKKHVSSANLKSKTKIKLDVGGTNYATSRTTLTSVAGSMLEAMFSGRHDLEVDEDGFIFLDRDGATFKLVLEFLRSPLTFSLEGLSKREVAACLAEFEYFALPSPVPSPPPPPPPPSLDLNMSGCGTKAVGGMDGSYRISHTKKDCRWSWAVGKKVLADEMTWKITIQGSPNPTIMLGVIANPNPDVTYPHRDGTFCGWYCKNKVYVAGQAPTSNLENGWPGWNSGDEAIFKLSEQENVLKFYLKRTASCYHISGLPHRAGSSRLCVITFTSGTLVTIAPVGEGDLAQVQENPDWAYETSTVRLPPEMPLTQQPSDPRQ